MTATAGVRTPWPARGFHALATDGELLVGFDGVTGLLASTDGGTSWTAETGWPRPHSHIFAERTERVIESLY